MFIYPLFTLFFYSHNPEEYENLRKKLRNKIVKYLKYEEENKDFYERNRKMVEANLTTMIEEKYPSPLYWNDIAGFISIRIENPIEGYRIVGEVWSIKNRRFKTKKIYNYGYGCSKIMEKGLIKKSKEFNKVFFNKVEEIIDIIKKDFLDKKKFFFNFEDNRLNWGLIKTSNIAKIIKELGSSWIY